LSDTLVTGILQVIVEKDQRVPADLVLLRTTERTGACFVRTDQLDGETDWKLRLSVPAAQKLESDVQLFDIRASLFVEKPQRDIHSFIGTFTRVCNILLPVVPASNRNESYAPAALYSPETLLF
jgi:phospholipid-translocating ATPase